MLLSLFVLHDRERNDGGLLRTLLGDAKGKRTSEGEGLLHSSALYRLMYYRILKKHLRRPAGYDDLNNDTVARSLNSLAVLSKQHGFKVLVGIFPDLKQLDNYQRQDEHESVLQLSEELGFETLDLLEPVQACGGNLGFDRYHLTERGHSCVAQALTAKLQEML